MVQTSALEFQRKFGEFQHQAQREPVEITRLDAVGLLQRGTIRRGLTIEDGSLAVTDNYLKVRIPPGHARNEWVQVCID